MIAIASRTWNEIKEIKKELSRTEEGRWEEMEFIRGVLLGKRELK